MAVTNVISQQIINVDNDTNYCFEVAPQGDSQARFVDVTLTTNSGTPYVIPNGSTVILEGKNAGGYNIFNSCIIQESNVIRIPLNNGVLTFAGVGKYCIAIYNGNSIQTFNFNIVVTEAPYDINGVIGSDQYEALNEIIAKASNSNTWIVKSVDPPTVCETGTNKNDYYLNATTGNVFYAELDTDGVSLIWKPLMNDENPPKQINLLGRVYIKYADDASGTNMSDSPVAKAYMGICPIFAGTAPTDPSKYTWALIKNDLNQINTKAQYAVNDDGENPPQTGWKDTIKQATDANPDGQFIWTKVHLEYQDGIYFEYFTVGKNDTIALPPELKNTVRVKYVLRANSGAGATVITDNDMYVLDDGSHMYDYFIKGYSSNSKIQFADLHFEVIRNGRANIIFSIPSVQSEDITFSFEIIRKDR